MPVKSENIQWDEIGAAAGPTLLPIGLAAAGWYFLSQKTDQHLWFKSLKKPNWALEDKQAGTWLEFAAIAPIGYASHMVYKEVLAKSDDRKLALSLYGAGLAASVVAIPAFMHTKDTTCWFGISLLNTLLFGGAAFTFYKVNPTAGWLLAPFVAWSAYGTISMFAVMQQNPNAGTDWTPKK